MICFCSVSCRDQHLLRATIFACFSLSPPPVLDDLNTIWVITAGRSAFEFRQKKKAQNPYLFKKTHAVGKYVQIECKLPPGRERQRQCVNVSDQQRVWSMSSLSLQHLSWVFLCSCAVMRQPDRLLLSSSLLRWVSPIVCCCAYTNKGIDREVCG